MSALLFLCILIHCGHREKENERWRFLCDAKLMPKPNYTAANCHVNYFSCVHRRQRRRRCSPSLTLPRRFGSTDYWWAIRTKNKNLGKRELGQKISATYIAVCRLCSRLCTAGRPTRRCSPSGCPAPRESAAVSAACLAFEYCWCLESSKEKISKKGFIFNSFKQITLICWELTMCWVK